MTTGQAIPPSLQSLIDRGTLHAIQLKVVALCARDVLRLAVRIREEVASIVIFPVSDAASDVTGANIAVSGGL